MGKTYFMRQRLASIMVTGRRRELGHMDLKERAKQQLPLTEATYYILISLVKPLHGYGIMQRVENISGGSVKLGPGTLYGAINKLLKEGIIRKAGQISDQDERRKCYILTELGIQVVQEEYCRLMELVRHGKIVMDELGVKTNGI